tara:strand:+ start:208 stop:516 length:309 start_codon:yes stop_codon:yes gene_type:complete
MCVGGSGKGKGESKAKSDAAGAIAKSESGFKTNLGKVTSTLGSVQNPGDYTSPGGKGGNLGLQAGIRDALKPNKKNKKSLTIKLNSGAATGGAGGAGGTNIG